MQPGDVVAKGQLLAEIDPSIPQATVEAGQAQLAGLRAQLAEQQAEQELARRQYARQQQMDREGSTRAEDVQVAEAAAKAATARVANLRAQIDQTASRLRGDQAQLGYTRRSPALSSPSTPSRGRRSTPPIRRRPSYASPTSAA